MKTTLNQAIQLLKVEKVIDELKETKNVDKVYLATDPDREVRLLVGIIWC